MKPVRQIALPVQQWQAQAQEEGDEIDDVEVEQEAEEAEETEEGETPEAEEVEEAESEDDADEDEMVVTVGDEEPPAEDEEQRAAPEWVKKLRKKSREDARRIRELERSLQEREAGAVQQPQAPADPGPKPTIEQFDYDAEEFSNALESWHDKKLAAKQYADKLTAEQESQQKAWQERLDGYGEAKAKLKIRDFDEAEATVLDTLSTTQQGIILQGAENPALVVYAIGAKPERVKALAGITDPVKFAFAVAKLEKDLKVSSRKAAPPPPEKRPVGGTAPKSGTIDSTLERLRAKAEKTGDYSEVTAYKRAQKRKAG